MPPSLSDSVSKMHIYRKQKNIVHDQSPAGHSHVLSSVFMNGQGIFPKERSMGVVAPAVGEL